MSWNHEASGKAAEVLASLEQKAQTDSAQAWMNDASRTAIAACLRAAAKLSKAAGDGVHIRMVSSGHFEPSGAGSCQVNLSVPSTVPIDAPAGKAK
jgi:hypothetical protein